MKEIINNQNEYRKLIRIKYHLFNKLNYGVKSINKKNVISFFGPTMLSKPIYDICSLINKDLNNNFEYLFVNTSNEDERKIKALIFNKNTVFFERKYLSNQLYASIIKNSRYVFLPHNYLYQGKLSGIFCDCVANGTPVISNNIDPISNYFIEFGPMGFIYNYTDSILWQEDFFEKCNNNNLYNEFLNSMKKCKEIHNEEHIIDEFLIKVNE